MAEVNDAPSLQLFTRGVGLAERSSPVPDALLAFALSVMIIYPRFLTPLHASMTPLVIVLFLIWANGALERQEYPREAHGAIALVATYTVCMVLVARLVTRLSTSGEAFTLEQLTLLLPLSVLTGWMLVRSGKIVQYLSWLLVVGVLTVIPAVYEYRTNTRVLRLVYNYLFPHLTVDAAPFVRNGHTRAIVGSDHPLVLGAFFLALIPIAMYLGGRYRYVAAVALYVGIWTTGSNGPEIVGGLMLAVCLIPAIARAVLSSRQPLIAFLTAIAIFLSVGAIWFWTPQIHGVSTTDASTGYRGALYDLLPQLLAHRPFGYGLSGLPSNTWYVSTTTGVVDIANSIDSELVYSVAQFGYIALFVFVLIAVFGALAAVRNQAIGLSSLSTTLVGLFLAIHAWQSLATLWYLGFGACAALVVSYDDAWDWTGLSDRRPEEPSQDIEMGVS